MADIAFTAANVIPSDGTKKQISISGEALNVGDSICLNPANDYRAYQFQSNDINLFRQVLVGISLSAALSAGQPIDYAYFDGNTVSFGAGTFEPGMFYMGSTTRGKICPVLDMAIFGITTSRVSSNIATLTSAIAHPFKTGQTVTIGSLGSIYLGGFTIASTPTATTFTYALTHADDGPNVGQTGTAQIKGIAVNILGIAQDDSNLQLLKRNAGIVR